MARVAFDPFAALGLPRDASASTIKATYHSLARRYHPNRHQGDDESKATLSDAFHNIHQAWKVLSKADNRRRRVELLKLLELQDEMLIHYEELLSPDSPGEHSDSHAHGSDLEGHISSDADEDLPNDGLQRRQTVLTKDPRALKQLGDRHGNAEPASPSSPSKRSSRWQSSKDKSSKKADGTKRVDYFMARRKKLTKLRRKELDAFEDYRDAMIVKFEAEEEAERQQEIYERAKWKREYFERAPRPTAERMRSFLNAMGAVTAFEHHAPRQRNRSSLSHSTMSPVVGPGEGPQLLVPDTGLSRKKSMHQRKWSNDISGDQTSSSDEDSGDAHKARGGSPPGHWHHYSRRARITYAGNNWSIPNGSSTDSSSGRRPSVEFQLVVRQPTDLATIAEAQDSSGDTPSGSSRTPSPQPNNPFDSETSKFTVVSHTDAATLFDMPVERRARSPSPVGHRQQISLTKPLHHHEAHHHTGEGCQFEIKCLVTPQHHHVPFAHVHLLSRHDKSHLLGSEPDHTTARPEALLEKLHHLCPDVASKFEVKPNMEEAFNFRLIYGNREVVSRQHQSFIALSYRRKLHVERHDHHYTLPLEPEIFQAVWDERKSDTEGVWIDQICIRQDDATETYISMSAMDMVYRSARMIAVALDDIELNAFEGQRLKDHIDDYNSMTYVSPRQRFRHKQPPWLETHEDLYKIIRKILGSSWFKRAWCRHEMRLAKHHIFLIPARRSLGEPGRDVLRFNSKSIAHLLDLATEVPWESEVESVKPALHAFFRDRSKMSPDEREMRSHHGNFSTVVAEVFAMEAGGNPLVPAEQRLSDARKDKIAIILNTMECGLALKRRFRIEGFYGRDNDCYHDLSILALAAGDPGVLCSVGAPLPISELASSWLYMPTVADAGLNETSTLERLPENARFVTHTKGDEHYIKIDLKFLPRRGSRPQMDQHLLDLARKFTDVCEEKEWGRNRKRYLTHDKKANRLFGPMKEIYVETLACVLHCGPDWMSDVCQRYSMSRWKVHLQGAYELLIALKNTYGRWPAYTWNERAAGFILDFVNFLIIRGLPTRQLSKPEPWRPLWVDRNGVKIITFAPVSAQDVYATIPRVLIHTDYVHLARLWILRPRIEHHESDAQTDVISKTSEWTLLGKSVLFSDEDSIGQMSTYGGDFKDQQRVYGRRKEGVFD